MYFIEFHLTACVSKTDNPLKSENACRYFTFFFLAHVFINHLGAFIHSGHSSQMSHETVDDADSDFFLTINQMICGKYGVFLLPVGILGWGLIL